MPTAIRRSSNSLTRGGGYLRRGRLVGLQPESRAHGCTRLSEDASGCPGGEPSQSAQIRCAVLRLCRYRDVLAVTFPGRATTPSRAPPASPISFPTRRKWVKLEGFGFNLHSAVPATPDAYPSTMAGCPFAAHCRGVWRSGHRPAVRCAGSLTVASAYAYRAPRPKEARQA